MTAYTSTQSGPWNDNATWGGGGYPSSSGDTWTMTGGHALFVPVGVSITTGVGATNAGTSGTYTLLLINGTFDLAGVWTFGNFTELALSGGAELDLNGYTITPGGNNKYTWIGTAANKWTVKSTGSAGSFGSPGASPLIPYLEYGTVTGIATSTLGRTHSSPGMVTFKNVLFDQTGTIYADETGTNAGAGFIWENCDVRDPVGTIPVYIPYVYQNGLASAGIPRYMRGSTFSSSGDYGVMQIANCRGLTIEGDNVFSNWRYVGGSGPLTFGGFWSLPETDDSNNQSFVHNNQNPSLLTVTDMYGFYLLGGHPFSPTGDCIVSGENVFEGSPPVKEGGTGTNWFLFGADSSGSTLTLKDALFIGEGNPVCVTAASNRNFYLSNNTSFLDNYGLIGSATYFATMLLTEGSGLLSGAVEIYNNIIVKIDTSTPNDSFIDLKVGTAGQLDFVNNNCGWALPNGPYNPPVYYTATAKAGGPADMGERDVTVDPLFFDPTRKLASWDAANGGPGTYDNAITELLKRNDPSWNSLYDPPKLIAWVREGFTPRQRRLANRGRRGGYIGAVRPRPKPPLRINPL